MTGLLDRKELPKSQCSIEIELSSSKNLITLQKMNKECPICIEKCKLISCMICNYSACKTCIRKYILQKESEVGSCMNCNTAYTRASLVEMLGITFVKDVFTQHQHKVRINKQNKLLPTFQPIAERQIKVEKLESEMKDLMEQYNKAIAAKRYEINSLRVKKDTEEKKYIRPCSVESCNGFLNTSWKCGICDIITCKDCFIPITNTEEEHVCEAGAKETATLIKKDTKCCPKCGNGIYKTEGCFGENTEILLWNGNIKMIQDIQIGDILIGDDGNKRTVLKTFNGEDDLYKIKQKNGIDYIVNSKHQLVLKYTGNNNIIKKSDNKYIIYTINKETFKRTKIYSSSYDDALLKINELDKYYKIKTEDFNNLGKSIKKELCGFKSNNLINWEYKPVDIDPYLFGVWIGDGDKNGNGFAINPEKDIEILEYLYEWCEKNNCELTHNEAYRFKIRRRVLKGIPAIGHGSCSNTCKGCIDLMRISPDTKSIICNKPNIPYNSSFKREKSHPFINSLKKYNLINNKYIPQDFIVNSEEIRLNVLAGIIDTDGWVGNDGKRIVIVQSNYDIVKNVELIARSLGYYVSVTSRERKDEVIFNKLPKDYKKIYKINISGNNINKIPTKINRKICKSSIYNKDIYKTQIVVESIGKGKYYGFELDGNHLFLLPDMTVQKNCDQMYCTICHTAFSWRTGQIETGRVHNPHYYQHLRAMAAGGEIRREAGDELPVCNGCQENITERFTSYPYTIISIVSLLKDKVKQPSNIIKILDGYTDLVRYYYHIDSVRLTMEQKINSIDRELETISIGYLRNKLDKTYYVKIVRTSHKKREVLDERIMIIITLRDVIKSIIVYIFNNNISVLYEASRNIKTHYPLITTNKGSATIVNTYIDILDDADKSLKDTYIQKQKEISQILNYCIAEDEKIAKVYSISSKLDIQYKTYYKFLIKELE